MRTTSTIARAERLARWPHRRFRPGSRAVRRWPLGLFGMLALVAAVEATIVRGGPKFVDHIALSWQLSARAAREQAPGCAVLCVGDSLVKHGLIPRALDAATGLRSCNLATAAAPVPINCTILRRALDAGARPRAVVFDMKPSVLVGGPEFSARPASGLLSTREIVEFCLAKNSRAYVAQMILGALLPSYRSQVEIRLGVQSAWRGEANPLTSSNAFLMRNWSVNRGANVATPRPEYHGEVTEAEHQRLLSRGFHADRVNAEYAHRLVALTADRGIATYVLLMPFVPELARRREATGAEAKYLNFIRSLQESEPRLTVLDARQSGYPASVFIDPVHLDLRGALALSVDVGAIPKADLDRPAGAALEPRRWIPLPMYKEPTVPADLEDVNKSRAIVEKEG